MSVAVDLAELLSAEAIEAAPLARVSAVAVRLRAEAAKIRDWQRQRNAAQLAGEAPPPPPSTEVLRDLLAELADVTAAAAGQVQAARTEGGRLAAARRRRAAMEEPR